MEKKQIFVPYLASEVLLSTILLMVWGGCGARCNPQIPMQQMKFVTVNN